MSRSPYRLLETAVGLYDEGGQPITPADVADRPDAPSDAVDAAFERFVDCELLVPDGVGYAPTITARELLELDLDGDVIVVDVETECS